MAEKYLAEAFKALNILDEDVFNIDADGTAELKDFVSNDETGELETIIDPLAETEEDLKDSYIGKVILDCVICQSKIYEDPDKVVINEKTQLANEDQICPYCQSNDGFKIIGQVTEFKSTELKAKDEQEESEEEIDEALKTKKGLSKMQAMKEDLNSVSIETDKETINITAEPKVDQETIAPISDTTKQEFKNDYEDVDVDEFNEEDFDELGESYLKKVYENVKSYKTLSGSVKGNNLKLEGLIEFKSGKKVKTNFIFEAKSITKTGKLKFLGENQQFAKGKKSFILTGKADGKKLIAESLVYNYRGKDAKTNESKRLYGRICKR